MKKATGILFTTVFIIIGLHYGTIPVYAGTMGEVAKETFGVDSIAFVIPELVLIGIGGYLMSLLLSAVGQGQIASMTKIATVFCCIYCVTSTAVKAIENVFRYFS